jgi:hypothetical protein
MIQSNRLIETRIAEHVAMFPGLQKGWMLIIQYVVRATSVTSFTQIDHAEKNTATCHYLKVCHLTTNTSGNMTLQRNLHSKKQSCK